MRHPLFVLLAAVSLSTAALAQPVNYPVLTLTDGTRYRDIVVIAVQPDGLRITHSEGAGKIPYEALPTEVAAPYHFDPQAAQEYRQREAAIQRGGTARMQALSDTARQREEDAAHRAALKKDAHPLRVKIIQIIPGGALADPYEPIPVASSTAALGLGGSVGSTYRLTGRLIYLDGPIHQAEGDTLQGAAARAGHFEYTDTDGIPRSIPRYIFYPKEN